MYLYVSVYKIISNLITSIPSVPSELYKHTLVKYQ